MQLDKVLMIADGDNVKVGALCGRREGFGHRQIQWQGQESQDHQVQTA